MSSASYSGAASSGGGDFLGSIIGGAFAVRGQKRANKAAKREAKRNRQFQRKMSSTAYQRGMKDMRAAGLNPMLAFSQGGASSPMGSIAPVQNIYGSLAEDITSGINSGIKRKEATDKGGVLKKQVMNVEADTLKKIAEAGESAQRTNTSGQTEKKLQQETQILEAGKPYRKYQASGAASPVGQIHRAFDWMEQNYTPRRDKRRKSRGWNHDGTTRSP